MIKRYASRTLKFVFISLLILKLFIFEPFNVRDPLKFNDAEALLPLIFAAGFAVKWSVHMGDAISTLRSHDEAEAHYARRICGDIRVKKYEFQCGKHWDAMEKYWKKKLKRGKGPWKHPCYSVALAGLPEKERCRQLKLKREKLLKRIQNKDRSPINDIGTTFQVVDVPYTANVHDFRKGPMVKTKNYTPRQAALLKKPFCSYKDKAYKQTRYEVNPLFAREMKRLDKLYALCKLKEKKFALEETKAFSEYVMESTTATICHGKSWRKCHWQQLQNAYKGLPYQTKGFKDKDVKIFDDVANRQPLHEEIVEKSVIAAGELEPWISSFTSLTLNDLTTGLFKKYAGEMLDEASGKLKPEQIKAMKKALKQEIKDCLERQVNSSKRLPSNEKIDVISYVQTCMKSGLRNFGEKLADRRYAQKWDVELKKTAIFNAANALSTAIGSPTVRNFLYKKIGGKYGAQLLKKPVIWLGGKIFGKAVATKIGAKIAKKAALVGKAANIAGAFLAGMDGADLVNAFGLKGYDKQIANAQANWLAAAGNIEKADHDLTVVDEQIREMENDLSDDQDSLDDDLDHYSKNKEDLCKKFAERDYKREIDEAGRQLDKLCDSCIRQSSHNYFAQQIGQIASKLDEKEAYKLTKEIMNLAKRFQKATRYSTFAKIMSQLGDKMTKLRNEIELKYAPPTPPKTETPEQKKEREHNKALDVYKLQQFMALFRRGKFGKFADLKTSKDLRAEIQGGHQALFFAAKWGLENKKRPKDVEKVLRGLNKVNKALKMTDTNINKPVLDSKKYAEFHEKEKAKLYQSVVAAMGSRSGKKLSGLIRASKGIFSAEEKRELKDPETKKAMKRFNDYKSYMQRKASLEQLRERKKQVHKDQVSFMIKQKKQEIKKLERAKKEHAKKHFHDGRSVRGSSFMVQQINKKQRDFVKQVRQQIGVIAGNYKSAREKEAIQAFLKVEREFRTRPGAPIKYLRKMVRERTAAIRLLKANYPRLFHKGLKRWSKKGAGNKDAVYDRNLDKGFPDKKVKLVDQYYDLKAQQKAAQESVKSLRRGKGLTFPPLSQPKTFDETVKESRRIQEKLKKEEA